MIELKQEDKIWIVKVEEEFATTNSTKAKEVMNQLAKMKEENGELYQLRYEQNKRYEKEEEEEHKQKTIEKWENRAETLEIKAKGIKSAIKEVTTK